MPNKPIGFKAWYAPRNDDETPRRIPIRLDGRSVAQVRSDLEQLPRDGFLVGMLYYDSISTITCHICRPDESTPERQEAAKTLRYTLLSRSDHQARMNKINQTRSVSDQAAVLRLDDHQRIRELANQPWNPDLKCGICDQTVRDIGIRYRRVVSGHDFYFFTHDGHGWIFAETDALTDSERYRVPIVVRGQYVSDEMYSDVLQEAMDDYRITEFGLTAQPGTTDE